MSDLRRVYDRVCILMLSFILADAELRIPRTTSEIRGDYCWRIRQGQVSSYV